MARRVLPVILLCTIAVVLGVLLWPRPSPARATGEALAVDCDASSSGIDTNCSYGPGATFSIIVNATNAGSGYAGYQVKVAWTDATLDYLPAANPATENQWPVSCIPGRFDNQPGDSSVLYGCVSIPSVVSSFTGALVRLEMQCQAPGTTALNLVPRLGDPQKGTSFIDSLANPIDAALTNASVSCGTGPTSTPTPTPTTRPPLYGAVCPAGFATQADVQTALASGTYNPPGWTSAEVSAALILPVPVADVLSGASPYTYRTQAYASPPFVTSSACRPPAGYATLQSAVQLFVSQGEMSSTDTIHLLVYDGLFILMECGNYGGQLATPVPPTNTPVPPTNTPVTPTNTPTNTATSTPPPPVGGISLDPPLPGSSGGDAGLLAGAMAAALATAVALGGGVWYVRRRRAQ